MSLGPAVQSSGWVCDEQPLFEHQALQSGPDLTVPHRVERTARTRVTTWRCVSAPTAFRITSEGFRPVHRTERSRPASRRERTAIIRSVGWSKTVGSQYGQSSDRSIGRTAADTSARLCFLASLTGRGSHRPTASFGEGAIVAYDHQTTVASSETRLSRQPTL